MPDPIKRGLLGLQSLLQHPDSRVMLVQGQANFEAASRLFPANPVLGWDGKLSEYHLGQLEGKHVVAWFANPLPQHVRAGIAQLDVPAASMAVFSPEDPAHCYPLTDLERRNPPKQWILAQLKPVKSYTPAPLDAKVNGVTATVPVEPQTAPEPSEKPRRKRTEATGLEFGLILNNQGVPVASLRNCVSVLEHHPELAGRIWYDVFLQRLLHTWDADAPREWSDYDDVRLALFYQREIGMSATKFHAHDAVVAYGMREKRNCAYDWMDSLQWDHVQRLWQLGPKGFGTSADEYECAVCRNLVLAMVKRVYDPGCKSDYMPIFEGSQGAGKSKALAILGGPWFAECHESIMSKDFFGVLQGKLLIEISEMHAFRQSEVERVKGIVSCPSDRYREPYGRNAIDHPRQGAFAGTTNRDDWNRDDTGARRFWPVKCGAIDHAWISSNREQLFAEAVYCIRDMKESHWTVPWERAKSEQDDRQHVDTWEDAVRQWLVGKGSTVTLGEVLEGAVDIETGKQELSVQQRMGRVLKKLGWIKRNVRLPDGKQQKRWANPLAQESRELFED